LLESVFGRLEGPMLYYGLYDAHDVALVTPNSKPVGHIFAEYSAAICSATKDLK
jgi:hypothetical protein